VSTRFQLFWVLNRLCDGLDGIVARVSGRQTDFGGYLDIGIDFTIYALIPVALAWSQQSLQLMTLVALMEGTYFVNAALLFQAAAISEKRALHTKCMLRLQLPVL
jgi:phosphatidylglycerophosphate synthase